MMTLLITTTNTEASEWEKYFSSSDVQSSTELEPEIGLDPVFEALHAQPEWLDPLPVKLVLEASEIVDLPKYCDEENFVAINAVEFLDKTIHSKIPESLSEDDAWGCAKNSIGWTVGTSAVKEHGRRAILRIGEREIDLNDILPKGSDWVLFSARGITDIEDGWIHIAGEGELEVQDTQFLLSIYMDLKNHAPILVTKNVTVDFDESSAVFLTAVDMDGDELTYTITQQPENGVLEGKGADYTFYPITNFWFEDSFAYTVSDGYITVPNSASGKSAAQTVWLGTTGGNATLAVPEDYDGDGTADVAVVYDRPPEEVHSSGSHGFFSLYAYRNTLYAGTYDQSGTILYSRNGDDWSQLVDFYPNPGESVYDMTFFRGYLYASTEDNGRLYRCRLDGTGQQKIDYTSESGSFAFAVEAYKGEIFVVHSGNRVRVYKSSTGNSGQSNWSLVANIGDQDQGRDLVVYRDSLYLLTDGGNSGRVYKWNDSNAFIEKINFDNNERPLRATEWAGYMWITTRGGTNPKKGRIHRWNGTASDATQVYESTEFEYFSNIKAFNGSLFASATDEWNSGGGEFGESALYRCDNPAGTTWRMVGDRFEPGSAFGLEGFNGQIYVGTMDEKSRGKIYRYQNGLEWYIMGSTDGFMMRGAGANILCPADYDGDETDDIALFDSPSGTWWIDLSNGETLILQNEDCIDGFPISLDYDGDGTNDPAVYNGDAEWRIYQSSTKTWVSINDFGYKQCEPVCGNYDNDDDDDLALYDQNAGIWYVRGNNNFPINIGGSNCVPVPGDYDGDKKCDPAVFDTSTYVWKIQKSQAGYEELPFGNISTTTVAVPGDYDGDDIHDLAILDMDTYLWSFIGSSAGYWTQQYGYYGTIPLSFDGDGDGDDDNAVYYAPDEILHISSVGTLQVGMKGKEPVPADYDGDDKVDIASRSLYPADNNRWHIMKSTEGFFVMDYGWSAAKAVPGDYDGGGEDDIAVFYGDPSGPDWHYFSSDTETYHVHWLGSSSTDDPVPADYDGDGTMDFGIRTSWGGWYIDYSGGGSFYKKYGSGWRHAVPTDYDGDGDADFGLYEQQIGRWYWMEIPGTLSSDFHNYYFGHQNAQPVPGDYNGDNAADYAVRDNNSDWSIMQTPVPPGDFRFEEFGW